MSIENSFVLILKGNIHGIGFRNKIKFAAEKFNLYGRVRNLFQDIVLLHIEGEKQNLNFFIANLFDDLHNDSLLSVNINKTSSFGYKDFLIKDSYLDSSDREFINDNLNFFESIIESLDSSFRCIILHLIDTIKKEKSSTDIQLNCFKMTPSKYIPEYIIGMNLGMKLSNFIPSFSYECWSQSIYRNAYNNILGFSIESLIDDKMNGSSFAESLGCKVPRKIQHDVDFDEINYDSPVVIKPTNGHSAFAFIVKNGNILNINTGETYVDMQSFREKVLVSNKSYGFKDKWIVEEYIEGRHQKIPYDIKVFCFYGKVGLLRLDDRNQKSTHYCWLNESFEKVDTGHYDKNLFDPLFEDRSVIDLANSISLEIPLPFLRIDFLDSKNGPVFCEFTPRPGNFHKFNSDIDTLLGKLYIDAKARLTADISKGKKFKLLNHFGLNI